MITTTDLAAKTGLSVKTLGRWVDQQILPAPHVGTHPSGRGKVGFWPDWAVDFCLRVIELREQGIALSEAAGTATIERYEALDLKFREESHRLVYGEKKIKARDGTEVELVDLLRPLVAHEVRASMLADKSKTSLLALLDKPELLSAGIYQIQQGYDMFLTFDGEQALARPDFLLHQAMASTASSFSIHLTPLYHRLLKSIGWEKLIETPRVMPSPSVWSRDLNNEVFEYDYYPGGEFGFQLIGGKAARRVGVIRKEGGRHFIDEKQASGDAPS